MSHQGFPRPRIASWALVKGGRAPGCGKAGETALISQLSERLPPLPGRRSEWENYMIPRICCRIGRQLVTDCGILEYPVRRGSGALGAGTG